MTDVSAEYDWSERRDEVDIDTDIDEALESYQDQRLPVLLDELCALVAFQGRALDAAELRSFAPGVAAFAEGRHRDALFYFSQELDVERIDPGLLFDKLLLWLGRRLEDAGQNRAALWAYTECEDDDADEAQERLRQLLGLDDYSAEKEWNEAIFDHYKSRVESEPKNASAWEVLALQYSLLDQPDEALQAAQATIDIEPHRQPALQLLIEIWGERGDETSLDALEAQIQSVLDAVDEDPWPHFAMAEFQYVHRSAPRVALPHCQRVLDLAPDHEDANDLMCMILHRLEDWDGLVAQLEAMIARGEDRFQLYDLYDDLSEIYRERLQDDDRADKAAERASLYQDAWDASEYVMRLFREDPTDGHLWRVLQRLLHENSRWDDLFSCALQRLVHEDHNGRIHEIYEDLFVVFQGHMVVPPWDDLRGHLQERIDKEESDALRLLLTHHLGWVTDQMHAEAQADEYDDDADEAVASEPGEGTGETAPDEANSSANKAPSTKVLREEAQTFAHKWAFFQGHPWFSRFRHLSFGIALLMIATASWIFMELHDPVWKGASIVGGVFAFLIISSFLHSWWAPKEAACLLCNDPIHQLQPLSRKAFVYSWAKMPGTSIPYWGRCDGCGFDTRLVLHPGTSGSLRSYSQLYLAEMSAESIHEDLLFRLDGHDEDSYLVEDAILLWDELFFCQQSYPELFEALQRCLLEEAPVFAGLKEGAPRLWAAWEEGKEIDASEDDKETWETFVSSSREERIATHKAMKELKKSIALRKEHLREKILSAKVNESMF